MRGNYRFLLILPLLVAVLSVTAVPVQAHAQLLEADPAPGSTLSQAPAEIRLTFNEPIGPDSRLSLFDDTFYAIPNIESSIDPQHPAQLVANLPPLERGVYNVNWTAVSTDGHLVSGSYRFQIGDPPPGPDDNKDNIWLIPLLLGGVVLLGVAFWIGRKQAATIVKRNE